MMLTQPLTNEAETRSEVTRLLLAWTAGDQYALDRLMPLVADELKGIAHRAMFSERADHTLQPTALVNEVYLRLVDRRSVSWKNQAHFLGFAAQTMRRILVDMARKRRTEKRGEGGRTVSLDELTDYPEEERDVELIALDDALAELAKLNERQSRVIELHFFAGLTFEEIGEVLGISMRTAKRDWRAARLWLYEVLSPAEEG